MKMVRFGIWLVAVGLFSLAVAQTSQEFALRVLELRGSVEARLPDGSQRSVRENEKLPVGSAVLTQDKSTVILEWRAHKAMVPLPVQCKQVQIVSSPDAFFSVACQPDGTVIVSVDQGSVFVSIGQSMITVPRARMLIVSPKNIVTGPMPLTKQEQVLWDMGGVR